ncbi:hypothetical protein AWB71_03164 [Caballeronia peredens]|nr:hypothetical protein AWB71_03164 [Caballeronia peredens]
MRTKLPSLHLNGCIVPVTADGAITMMTFIAYLVQIG